MPGVTTNRLYPYPLFGETVDATSWQNLANAVDADFTTADLLRADAQRRPLAYVATGANQAITSGVLTNMLWDTDIVAPNPATMHSTSVNTDRITVPTPGAYFCALRGFGQGTPMTVMQLTLTVNGTPWQGRSAYTVGLGLLSPSLCGLVLCQNAGDIIRSAVKLTGTAPLQVIGGSSIMTFLVYRVSRL